MKYFFTCAFVATCFTKSFAADTTTSQPVKYINITAEVISHPQALDKLQVESENTVTHSLVNMSEHALTKAKLFKKSKPSRIRLIKKVDPNRH